MASELQTNLQKILNEKETKIIPENIKAGVQIFDIQGNFTSDADATAEDIAKDKTAYVNGEKVVGTKEASSFDDSQITNAQYLFFNNTDITEAPIYDARKTTSTSYMFRNCTNLISCGSYDFQICSTFTYMFSGCSKLTTVDLLNMERATSLTSMFQGCSKLTNLGGFANLGQGYVSTASGNNSSYKLDLSVSNLLTHDSLMNVINTVYDLKSDGKTAQTIQVGSTNKAKLTAEEIAMATNKYWIIS